MAVAWVYRPAVVLVIASGLVVQPPRAPARARTATEERQAIDIRGRSQVLHLSGTRGGTPVIVSSGDGGWVHLAPHVAETLARNGCFVVGFDTRAYLESFTRNAQTLRVGDEPGDYRVLVDFASRGSGHRPLLLGVSEGAGLSVLAAADARNKPVVAGVVAVGLSDLTELGWRWRDMVIYLTHGVPNEPTFSVKGVIDSLAPVPLAAIHSAHDEYAPVTEIRHVLERAGVPKRLWVIDAADHRFSNNLSGFDRTLADAITWIGDTRTGAAQ